jgi:hypothetical protein
MPISLVLVALSLWRESLLGLQGQEKGGKWTQAWTSVEGREDGIAAQPNPAAILGPW